MLEINTKLNKNSDVVFRGINNRFWALDTKSGAQFRLNELSFDILSAIDGKTTIATIIKEQQKKYNVDSSVLEKDVLDLISKAIENNIVLL